MAKATSSDVGPLWVGSGHSFSPSTLRTTTFHRCTISYQSGSAQHEDDVLVLGSIHLRSELAAGLPKLVLKLLLHAIPCRLLTLR